MNVNFNSSCTTLNPLSFRSDSFIIDKEREAIPALPIQEQFCQGEMKNGLSGKRKITVLDETISPLEIQNVKRKITLANGSICEGEFKNGLNGKIKINLPNGTIYEGELKNGMLHGDGKKICTDGTIFEGEFESNVLHGTGKITYANGTIFQGKFQKGELQGNGKKSYVDGIIHAGQFEHGHLNGYGEILYSNGDSDRGKFVKGKLIKGKKIRCNGQKIVEGKFRHRKLYESSHPQIQTSKKPLTVTDVFKKSAFPKYLKKKHLESELNTFGPTKTGITESYVWEMRKRIFGFSIGQAKSIKKLRRQIDMRSKVLESILEGGYASSTMLYLLFHLDQLIDKTRIEEHDPNYLADLERLQSDLKRSLPFVFYDFIKPNENLDSNLIQLASDISQELIQMKPNDKLLIPTGVHDHTTLLVFQKMADGSIVTTHYNTGYGVEYHLTKELCLFKESHHQYKDYYPITKSHPPFDLGIHQTNFESMMIKLLKLRIEKQSRIKKINQTLEKHLGKGNPGSLKPVQKSGVCSFQVFTEAVQDIFSSKFSYDRYRFDFLNHIQKEFEEITDAMKSLVDQDVEIQRLYPLHCLLLKENQVQINNLLTQDTF